jgi:tetrahydromethanopterin S-methyltransferase subunit G
MSETNGRVPLREYLELRFDMIEKRLDGLETRLEAQQNQHSTRFWQGLGAVIGVATLAVMVAGLVLRATG